MNLPVALFLTAKELPPVKSVSTGVQHRDPVSASEQNNRRQSVICIPWHIFPLDFLMTTLPDDLRAAVHHVRFRTHHPQCPSGLPAAEAHYVDTGALALGVLLALIAWPSAARALAEQDELAGAMAEELRAVPADDRKSFLESLDGRFFPPRVSEGVKARLGVK